MKSVAMLWACAVLITGASGASAQKMYRCGSVYQDRPCEAGGPEKVMRSSAGGAESASATGPAADPYCIKRGKDAQQIMWARESGKTAEDLSRQAQNDQQRQLIAEVYAQRGTAPQVRDAIQAQCQRDRDLLGPGVLPRNAHGGGSYTPEARPMESSPDKAATSAGYNNCDYFKAEQDSIRNQERQGGSIQFMESLRQRRSTSEQAARARGC